MCPKHRNIRRENLRVRCLGNVEQLRLPVCMATVLFFGEMWGGTFSLRIASLRDQVSTSGSNPGPEVMRRLPVVLLL